MLIVLIPIIAYVAVVAFALSLCRAAAWADDYIEQNRP